MFEYRPNIDDYEHICSEICRPGETAWPGMHTVVGRQLGVSCKQEES
jgi:hypothetical protein